MLYPIELGVLVKSLTDQNRRQLFYLARAVILQQIAGGAQVDCPDREGITFAPAVGDGVFCEPSTGAVDFDAFRDTLQEIHYHCGPDKPLPIARKTREYLNEIGIG